MITIWKYEIKEPEVTLMIPEDAKVLDVQLQDGTPIPCIWVAVDTDNILVERKFRIHGTGHKLEYKHAGAAGVHYVGTFQLQGFVWHLFEV